MSPKEQLTPGDFQSSMEKMRLLADFANGKTVFPTADTELSDEYRDAVVQYGNYCIEAFRNPEFSGILFKYSKIENKQISIAGSRRGRRVYLRKDSEGKPQLYFAILDHGSGHLKGINGEKEFEQFQSQILGKFGDVDYNPWVFRRTEEYPPFPSRYGNEHYHEASRLFKPEDLLDNNLLSLFVAGVNKVLDNTRKEVMLGKVGTIDEEQVRQRVDAFIQANEILQPFRSYTNDTGSL